VIDFLQLTIFLRNDAKPGRAMLKWSMKFVRKSPNSRAANFPTTLNAAAGASPIEISSCRHQKSLRKPVF
jgi:hypothetical protein